MSDTKQLATRAPWRPVRVGEKMGGAPVFEVFDSSNYTLTVPMTKDEAHLVAAAPSLYEALEALVGCIMETRGPDTNAALEAARTALASARGE